MAAKNPLGAVAGVVTEIAASDVLDSFSTSQGAVLYRNATGWVALAPGTSGQVLQSGGSSANPSWVTPSSGGGRTAITLNSDVSESAGTATNVTGTSTNLGFSASAGVTYTIDATLLVSGSANTVGILLGFTVPTGALVDFTYIGPTGFNSTSPDTGNGEGSGTFSSNSNSLKNSTSLFVYMLRAHVRMSTTAGTVQLQVKRNGSGTITVKAGSRMFVE